MNPETKFHFDQLKEEAAAAIELDVPLANFLAGLPQADIAIGRKAYEAAMAEDIMRHENEGGL